MRFAGVHALTIARERADARRQPIAVVDVRGGRNRTRTCDLTDVNRAL